MKFSSFKEFRYMTAATVMEIAEYLRVDVTKTLRDLTVGLTRLRFTENFTAFKVDVTIPATSELAIRNQFRDRVPTERLVVRGNSSAIIDGDTEWNLNFVYLKNTAAVAATVTVIFLE